MTEHRVSYTLDSTLETVDSAEQAAGKVATEAGFDEDEVMRISMAVREAAVNAVLHGNAYDPGKKVSLVLERTAVDLVITIRDQGKGLDMSKIPDPLAPENLLKTSGRGIFLIRSFMDEVQIHPSQTGTEIKLIKHVTGHPRAARRLPSEHEGQYSSGGWGNNCGLQRPNHARRRQRNAKRYRARAAFQGPEEDSPQPW